MRSVVNAGGQTVSTRDRLYLPAAIPTLIVWGDNDPIIPVSHGIEAHELMPGSRLEIFAGVGHFPQVEVPTLLCAVLTDFLATTEPATIRVSSRSVADDAVVHREQQRTGHHPEQVPDLVIPEAPVGERPI